ncbi:MbtH protein [Jatrophihabitans endophyticus]|uniref:MbtH protein n=1 Tax=Jatrophihabitans endophyticus TaxID=1206085 RepID=A0A1M5CR83_9ACTN|nr:MbtH family NRPS accessory protein [Jatrophihabitans endophyticus]SHF57270.1 MbtH protein [Jatrophihabitans endophyticus]
MSEPEDDRIYTVVRNDEGQYALWPADLDVPAGWVEQGRRGTEQECSDWVDTVWTDMRPLSLVRASATPPPATP